MKSLKLLTDEQKEQAFERAISETEISGGKLVRITKGHYQKALNVIRDYFVSNEPLHRASGAKWGSDMKQMHMQHLSNNISIMIENEVNGDIIGIASNLIEEASDTHGCEEMTDPGFRNVYHFLDICEQEAALLNHFKMNEVVHLASLVVNEKYRHQGFGTKLVEATVSMCRHLVPDPVCIKIEGSSFFTQKIAEKIGFKKVYERLYTDYTMNCKRVFDDADVHKSVIIYGMLVNDRDENV